MQDFHSAIEGALSNEEYMRELREAMLEEAAAELAAGEERAAQSALRKAELKVWPCPACGSGCWVQWMHAQLMVCTVARPTAIQQKFRDSNPHRSTQGMSAVQGRTVIGQACAWRCPGTGSLVNAVYRHHTCNSDFSEAGFMKT